MCNYNTGIFTLYNVKLNGFNFLSFSPLNADNLFLNIIHSFIHSLTHSLTHLFIHSIFKEKLTNATYDKNNKKPSCR